MQEADSPPPAVGPISTRVIGATDIASILEITGRDEFMDLMIEELRARFESFDAPPCSGRPPQPAPSSLATMLRNTSVEPE